MLVSRPNSCPIPWPRPDRPALHAAPDQYRPGSSRPGYWDRVKLNFRSRGTGGALVHGGLHAALGNLGGWLGLAVASRALPPGMAQAVGQGLRIGGALGGLLYGLQDVPRQARSSAQLALHAGP